MQKSVAMQAHAPLVTAICAAIGALCTVSGIGQHGGNFKSIQSSAAECNLYLPADAVRQDCGTRCVALVNRIWNDTAGRLSETVGRFYTLDPKDPGAHNRTSQCVKQVIATVPSRNSCKLADASVNCYRSNYGRLDVATPRYVPFTDVQQVRILSECAAMLGVSHKLTQVVRNGMQSIPEGACLLRCLLMRQGLYTDRGGPDLGRLSVQCGGYGPQEQEWRANVTQCVAKVQAECIDDKCVRAERIAVECLVMRLKFFEARSPKLREHIPFGIVFDVTTAAAGAGATAVATVRVITYIYVYYYF
ncbi:general odorant-binding protein 45-like [Armigeres subalbatus]|uniref:general odorant-binding protein 45-like n=1 Tax=Armigeres subalbatus TaxID=124917 RepID=UPI002ED12F9F